MEIRKWSAGKSAGVFIGAAICAAAPSAPAADATPPMNVVNTSAEPIAQGKFEPTWQSLSQYKTPEWFTDAKFGIWAHWGPQCEANDGDWYARNMYIEGSQQYKYQLAHFGHPSVVGFKDVIHQWKAEKWDPEKLLALYKRAGAKYFVALANHHDNFDNFDSKYQPWNATKMGPETDLIGRWAKAARAQGLKFGVSVHASHAWTWYEPSQGADKTGPKAGVPYDGKLTKADGKGTWWDGLDPQDLYAQNHPLSASSNMSPMWTWGHGASVPDAAYCEKFYNRTADLIQKYQPDLLYFDDTALPLWPVSDAGLKIAADYYNDSMARHDGQEQGVLFGKGLTDAQRHCLTLDIERGRSDKIEPTPWQTDTCIGSWHYDQKIFDQHRYKSATLVVRTLVDIVSKNGNLLLSVPVRGDGTIDSDELAIVTGIGDWMEVNHEAIFDTRPWQICGEGPALKAAPTTQSTRGFNESKGVPLSAKEVRFTAAKDGSTLYATVLGWPTSTVQIASLGTAAHRLAGPITDVQVLGAGRSVKWQQQTGALTLDLSPATSDTDRNTPAVVFKIRTGK